MIEHERLLQAMGNAFFSDKELLLQFKQHKDKLLKFELSLIFSGEDKNLAINFYNPHIYIELEEDLS